MRYQDGCSGPHCNSQCPETISLGEKTPYWDIEVSIHSCKLEDLRADRHTHIYTNTPAHIHTHTPHTHTHTDSVARMQTHIYTHEHTHTHAHTQIQAVLLAIVVFISLLSATIKVLLSAKSRYSNFQQKRFLSSNYHDQLDGSESTVSLYNNIIMQMLQLYML